ncbi:helix-turn-helix domain-containing protein [Salegentibacter maritimus]|uniref:helix-turn-helix domain-containing protein n=1 Tax=Salegentibacter maritimus TaxID=2794347 RepID=UPI0018E474A0|nr:helix-turn-helix domain-containing protein [Salegentibacter maritimus]MBI6116759.1 hypothetical protein [Salegentibacter maritimus]
MQENSSLNANLILNKLKVHLGIDTDVKLSKALKIKPNTLSTWKQRNSLDYRLIIGFAQRNNLDLNLIFNSEKTINNPFLPTKYTPIVTKEYIQQYTLGKLQDKLINLPRYNFLLGEANKNIAFQVTTNRLAPKIPEESFAICDLSDINKIDMTAYYVLISKKYGFFISRIQLFKKGEIELLDIQTTGTMKNYIISKNNIFETWKVIGVSTYKPL